MCNDPIILLECFGSVKVHFFVACGCTLISKQIRINCHFLLFLLLTIVIITTLIGRTSVLLLLVEVDVVGAFSILEQVGVY